MAPRSGSGSSDDPDGGPDRPPDSVLMTVTLDHASPAAAARELGIPEAAIDAHFGVVEIDPARKLFAVKIPQTAVPWTAPGEPFRGPFADPRVGRAPPKKPPGGSR